MAQRLFGSIFAGHPTIVVPAVHDAWCGPRVLTTTWQTGRDFEALCATAGQEERNRIGAALFDFYVGTLYRRGLFHADPHPGNYEFLVDGRVVVFDYGCVRVFEPEVARAFAIARLRLPGRLVFLFRIRFGLYAVLSRLKAVCDWSEMERGFAAEQSSFAPVH